MESTGKISLMVERIRWFIALGCCFRLSGVTSNIQKLRNAFDEDRIPNLYTEDILQDIHSVASLLKMYFR